MFGSLYGWAMRNGSRLLFAIAAIMLVMGLVQSLHLIGRFGPENELHADWLQVVAQILAAFSYTVMPLLGSLLVNRLDRWLALRHGDPDGG
jgi:hypothetical protein